MDANKTPLQDLKNSALNHYEEASTSIHHWNNQIPQAIEFWYDYKEMNFWQKIKIAFKRQ